MIYRLKYIANFHAEDEYFYGGMDYSFEADSVEEAQELARLEKEAKNKEFFVEGFGDNILAVYVARTDLPKAKDKIAELKKELGL